MTEQVPKTSAKSKKWIDYSSQQENQHYEDQELQQKLKQQNQLLESKHQPKTQQQNYLPILSTSHEPVKKHLLEDRKQLLEQLRQIKGNLVWIELSVTHQNNFEYLKNKVDSLKKQQNKDIVSIYPSRDNKNAYDLRIAYDLCEKWIVEGIDPKNLIKIELRKKSERQKEVRYQSKYEAKNYQPKNDYEHRPIKQYQPQHTTSTRYQPKYTEKKKYIQKNVETQEIEKKVEQGLKERKKDQGKKDKGSKFYSKNPFDTFNDSD